MAKPDFTQLLKDNPNLKVIEGSDIKKLNSLLKKKHNWFPCFENVALLGNDTIQNVNYEEGTITFTMPYKTLQNESKSKKSKKTKSKKGK